MHSPLGQLLLCADDEHLHTVSWQNGSFDTGEHRRWQETQPCYFHTKPKSSKAMSLLGDTVDQLREYFQGTLKDFQLPLYLDQGTPFQQSVWRVLSDIPYGGRISYADVASKISNPNASRAVGSACGSNPISVIRPCHRVVASDEALHGYGGGLERKEHLLKLEAEYA